MDLADLTLSWGGDLELSPSGDLATASGTELVTQRITRRLLTAAPSYFWNPNYGAGLGASIGAASTATAIKAIILAQTELESTISQSPPPTVSVTNPSPNIYSASIQ